MRLSPLPAALAALGLLAGCAAPPSFDRPAGALLGDGFGEATLNNTLVATGQIPYAVSLQQRFAREVPATVTFPFDSAALTPLARAALDQQAAWMRAFPELRFSVYGHADEIGPHPYNEALGRQRARAVVAYLAARGVPTSRLDALVSFGETRPLIPDAGRERLNRRAVTTVSGFVPDHPLVLNGKYAQVVFREYVRSAVPPAVVVTESPTEG